VPADTWVELTFVDQDGVQLPSVRRTQIRKANGRLSEIVPDFTTLGVDPISMRIGTVMPALLHFLQVGQASDLGLAAAKLTGLADLSNLARHAMRVRTKLRSDFKDERDREIKTSDGHFVEARDDLQRQIDDFEQMSPGRPLPAPSTDIGIEAELDELDEHFNGLKARALKAAQTILGDGFDPTDKSARDNLEQSIGPAQGQLKALGHLSAARRLKSLTDVTDLEWNALNDTINDIYAEAEVLAELATNPDVARRKQLYARVASWAGDNPEHDAQACAVCSRALDGALDPVTQKSVADHLLEASEENKELLSLTQVAWAQQRLASLTAKCPAILRQELTRDLPDHPRVLISALFVDDLFQTDAFSGALAVLRIGVQGLCDRVLTDVPPLVEPAARDFPEALAAITAPLSVQIRRLLRARAFGEWRAASDSRVVNAFKNIMRGSGPAAGQADKSLPVTTLTPIGPKLEALSDIVRGVAPINAGLEFTKRMRTHLATRRTKEKRLALYERAAAALEPLAKIGELAEKQVEGLRTKLHARAKHWRDMVYANAYATAGHALRETAMDVKGVLDIRVGSTKAHAPAQHVSNASALRASLLGFFLAFWEHVLTQRGGIGLLLLDDPQELLDDDNRERLARALPALAHAGAQLLVTTHDRAFARAVCAASRQGAEVEHRSVHPVNATRATLETALAVEQLDGKRRAFELDSDDAPKAQDYASEVRVFLEARLGDLFDDPAYPAYSAPSKSPTLADHINRLRGLVATPPNALFKGSAVRAFCDSPSLATGSEPLRVLNTSHHAKASLSAGEIYAIAGELDQVRKLAEKMHLEFRHWRWNEPLKEPTPALAVSSLTAVSAPSFNAVIYPDLAAFTGHSGAGESQDATTEMLDASWFADKALFYLKTDNLGFAAPTGSIVIVETTPYAGKDHNLVIARQKHNVLARRLLRGVTNDALGLSSETTDPRRAKPTLVFSQQEITLHRIVGVIFANGAAATGKGEAIEVLDTSGLKGIQCGYRVTEDSAVPLALPGQIVLGAQPITADQLDANVGELVAVTLRDGKSLFKRVGNRLPVSSAPLRNYESIGGLGASVVIADEEIESMPDLATFAFARRIIGVLYDT